MWNPPPITKIYEALGAVADDRLSIEVDTAKCFSSSGNKYYDIAYDPARNAIMTNDNGSYWKDYLGYPAIAFLLKKEILPYREDLAALLKGVPWKDINQKFHNDFDAALDFILETLDVDARKELNEYAQALLVQIQGMKIEKLGNKTLPPSGY